MATREQIWRAFQAVAVPVLLGLISRQIWPSRPEQTPTSLYLPLLADIDFVPRTLPATYRKHDSHFEAYDHVSLLPEVAPAATPDVTAVILNWSRFPNVILIASLLCGPWLEGTISEVFIWNNSPRHITYEEMKNTGCSKSKLRIYNAPSNLLFQARFVACAQASTPYCFVQDDDYLVRPEIIQSLRVHMAAPDASRVIHLLPPHEHLSTTLRETDVQSSHDRQLSSIQTSFAWLGHGTMLHRSEAQSFLRLMRYLDAPPDDMKMADNFFTILSNRVPEVWHDQGFELGGGQPFTVGSEGDDRNKKYILRATRYLESLAHCGRVSCDGFDRNGSGDQQARPQLPYITLDRLHPQKPWIRAACRVAACVLETNIRTLPDDVSHTATNISDMLSLEIENARTLGDAGKQNYLDHAPSNAVDGKAYTVFRSLYGGKKGDKITLDVLTDISEARRWTAVELVLLVDSATEVILNSSLFGWSSDDVTWRSRMSFHVIPFATILRKKPLLTACNTL
ncbi:hypothetical protein GSI_06170 [Ganoderma sinense ZZ0214-1]|uniref:Glycosyl transferase 64 domain-containing protein n=1 Tax=Ganoderma sinense ZZ0214-1 TaxID=1077348 RepID=A0A2G8SD03_9APHY|nr:hypothetical protein GSI_06170 [Ganoderma sinense ZZ0214-1]